MAKIWPSTHLVGRSVGILSRSTLSSTSAVERDIGVDGALQAAMRSRPSARAAALLLAVLATAPGCMTLAQGSNGKGPAIFGGVRTWEKLVFHPFKCAPPTEFYVFLLPVWLPVFAFDVVGDTLFLPISVPNEIARGGIEIQYP